MRKLKAFIVLLLMSVVLVACAGEDEDPEPTAAPTAPPVSTRIVESTPEPTEDAGEEATPAPEMATPDAAMATPAQVVDATPATAATPAMRGATPMVSPMASPAATPVDAAGDTRGPLIAPIGGQATPDATPVPTGLNEPPVRIEMSGVVTLDGRENEAFILTDEGCVGLGDYSGLRAERQVVIRNENGTIVSVTLLEASDEADGCAWRFVAAVPESEFYSVSIPMVVEQVFPKAQVGASGGQVEITLP